MTYIYAEPSEIGIMAEVKGFLSRRRYLEEKLSVQITATKALQRTIDELNNKNKKLVFANILLCGFIALLVMIIFALIFHR